jgi:hypothetical protein
MRAFEAAFVGGDGQPTVYFRYVCAVDDPGRDSIHKPMFAIGGDTGGDRLLDLLLAEADGPMRTRLLEPATEESKAMLESACRLPELVQSFYQTLTS